MERKSRVLSTTKNHADQSKKENPIRLVTDQGLPGKQNNVLRTSETKTNQVHHPRGVHKEEKLNATDQTPHVSFLILWIAHCFRLFTFETDITC